MDINFEIAVGNILLRFSLNISYLGKKLKMDKTQVTQTYEVISHLQF